MVDRLSKFERSQLMSRVKGRDTKPELVVRSALHLAGFRFSLHKKELAGRPDIVLPKWRVVIFVNGCFWHGHDCTRAKLPTKNVEFWTDKIAGNKMRDETNTQALRSAGWQVFTIWTCNLKYGLPQLLGAMVTMRNQISIELTK